jgi:ABC-type multidrug transport system ATPase subunit
VSTFSVEAKGISRVYGRQRALQRLDLTLAPGSATALLGPNGAGKSTLCGILATLVRPSTGEVRFGGAAGAAARAAIGLCAHDSLCYGDLSARENLLFFAGLYDVPDPRVRASELLGRVALEGAADRPARTYSRGMLQRLALARALVHRPRFLLLDEPFTGLDRAGVDRLGEILRDERARGTILLVVTHDFDAVAGLVDRVVVLERGHLAHDGPAPATAAELREAYARAIASGARS